MDNQTLIQQFIDELKAEDTATHKCLERVNESTYEFKPHEKSMNMGYLVLLVAEIPRWIAIMVKDSVINFNTYEPFKLSTGSALLKHYEQSMKDAITALENMTDEQVNTNFELRNGEQFLYGSPKLKSISETINHWVHHRGQLTVYMRLNDIAVPSIYGPSADEKHF